MLGWSSGLVVISPVPLLRVGIVGIPLRRRWMRRIVMTLGGRRHRWWHIVRLGVPIRIVAPALAWRRLLRGRIRIPSRVRGRWRHMGICMRCRGSRIVMAGWRRRVGVRVIWIIRWSRWCWGGNARIRRSSGVPMFVADVCSLSCGSRYIVVVRRGRSRRRRGLLSGSRRGAQRRVYCSPACTSARGARTDGCNLRPVDDTSSNACPNAQPSSAVPSSSFRASLATTTSPTACAMRRITSTPRRDTLLRIVPIAVPVALDSPRRLYFCLRYRPNRGTAAVPSFLVCLFFVCHWIVQAHWNRPEGTSRNRWSCYRQGYGSFSTRFWSTGAYIFPYADFDPLISKGARQGS